MVYYSSTSDRLSATFAALADPTRRAMLTRLKQGETTVAELAKPFKMSAPAISKHLKVLEKAGLITREKDAQWRRCRIEAARLKEANEFIEKYRKFWGDSFDRLEIYLRKLQSNAAPHGPDGHLPPIFEGGREEAIMKENKNECNKNHG